MIPWGGGTSIVEGLRLGCKVIGSDINPVAWFVTKKEIDIFDEELTDSYFFKLEKKLEIILSNSIKPDVTTDMIAILYMQSGYEK